MFIVVAWLQVMRMAGQCQLAGLIGFFISNYLFLKRFEKSIAPGRDPCMRSRIFSHTGVLRLVTAMR
jgi:hypothetical protein